METSHPPTIIACGALISVLAVVFYALLYPVRQNQKHLEKDVNELKKGQTKLETDVKELKIQVKQIHDLLSKKFK